MTAQIPNALAYGVQVCQSPIVRHGGNFVCAVGFGVGLESEEKMGDEALHMRYERQLAAMRERALGWMNDNRGAVVKIQFNFPPDLGVIAPINDALQMGFVSANFWGLELLRALLPFQPTVIMVRAVVESLQGQALGKQPMTNEVSSKLDLAR